MRIPEQDLIADLTTVLAQLESLANDVTQTLSAAGSHATAADFPDLDRVRQTLNLMKHTLEVRPA